MPSIPLNRPCATMMRPVVNQITLNTCLEILTLLCYSKGSKYENQRNISKLMRVAKCRIPVSQYHKHDTQVQQTVPPEQLTES